jgi:WD40 repeat protein
MFDPYHKWLGIPKGQRPPTFYQLLGVAADEQDPEVIEEAAIRQTTHVRAYQTGPHATDCTRILKEIATARLTLLDPAKRKQYDEQLPKAGKVPGASPPVAQAVSATAITAAPPQPVAGRTDVPAEAGDPRFAVADPVVPPPSRPGADARSFAAVGLVIAAVAGGGLLFLLLIGVAAAFFFFSRGEAPPPGAAGPVAEHPAKVGKKAVRDFEEVKKDKEPEKPKKPEDVKKDGEPKVEKPGPAAKPPQPEVAPVTLLTAKGRVAPELLIELPKDLRLPTLTTDGLRVACLARKPGLLAYREAPAFDVEHQAEVAGETILIQPSTSSPDGKKMALFPLASGAGRVLLWDWDRMAVEASFDTVGRPDRVVFAPDHKHLAMVSTVAAKGMPPQFWVQLYRTDGNRAEINRWQLDNTPVNFLAFTPDADTFLLAPYNRKAAHTYALKTNQAGETPFTRIQFPHTFSADFKLDAVAEFGKQLQLWGVEPLQLRRTVRGPDAAHIDGASFSPDNRYLLVATHVGAKPEDAQGQVALVEVQSGDVISVTDTLPSIPSKAHLGANGLALVQRIKQAPRLYRFPTGPGDTFAALAAPKKGQPVTKEKPVAQGDPPKGKEPAPAKVVRAPVPDPDKVLEAEKAIHEQFKKEYAKKAAVDALALADKLYRLAGETTDDPVACYVLLREARDLAVRAGRAELAMKVVTELAARYEVDELAMRVDALTGLSKATLGPESSKQFVEVALQYATGATLDDHFEAAGKLVSAADAVARRANSLLLTGLVEKQDKHLKEVVKEYAEMKQAEEKLGQDARDPEANLTVGLFLAFRKGHWEQGLPLLARAGDADLQDLAKKDLAGADDDKVRAELGDAWWAGAEKRPAYQKAAMQLRAAHWYRQALPGVKGLTEAKLVERIKQVDAQPGPFRVVIGPGELERFKGHAGLVNWLGVSADGKRVYSCGQDGTLRSWELASGKSRVLLSPPLTKASLTCFAFSPDEHQVAALYFGNRLNVFDLATLKPVSGGDREAVPGFFWTNNTTVAYAFKTTWNTWGLNPPSGSGGPVVFGNPPVPSNVRALVMAPGHDAGAVLLTEGNVVTFRVPDSGLRQQQATIDFDATAAAFPKDGRFIVLAGKDGNLRAYHTAVKGNDGAKELGVYKGHSGTLRALACTPDGHTMISGGDDKTMRFWDVASGRPLQLCPHPGAVTALAVTPDGRYVISACADSVIRVWGLPK